MVNVLSALNFSIDVDHFVGNIPSSRKYIFLCACLTASLKLFGVSYRIILLSSLWHVAPILLVKYLIHCIAKNISVVKCKSEKQKINTKILSKLSFNISRIYLTQIEQVRKVIPLGFDFTG